MAIAEVPPFAHRNVRVFAELNAMSSEQILMLRAKR